MKIKGSTFSLRASSLNLFGQMIELLGSSLELRTGMMGLFAYNSYKKSGSELFLNSRLSKIIIQIGYIGMERNRRN
ncbi:MAG: hypothetical protein CMF23_18350 [Ignavibacteriae bacterium]|nr:hypothetical protein [Ignavibacteriota bacterium]